MEFNSFLEKFNDNLIEDDVSKNNADTKFRELGSWDSLTAMAIITMIDEDYGVRIPDQTFKSFNTVGEIYNYVESNGK